MTKFQIIVLSVFGFLALFAVLVFSGYIPGLNISSSEQPEVTITLWGTVSASSMFGILDDFNRQYKPMIVSYTEKSQATFDRELTEALASGVGPDLIMLPRELIYRHADKLSLVPYSAFSERDFKNTFVQEGEIFLTGQGIMALPWSLDPMVMYWNRDIFSNAGISLPPKTWEELLSEASTLTVRDSSGNITQSAVAFGEFSNVNHAKDIIAMLTMQAGSPIVTRTNAGLTSVLGSDFGSSIRPADAAVRYYTDFSNPVQPFYSWSKSLPNSRDYFLSGNLAVYFGYASELNGLRALNPHLNFDVTRVPQTKGTSADMTIGEIDGVALLRSSRNPGPAYNAAVYLTSRDYSLKLGQKLFLPPPRRDILASKPGDAYMNIFFDSALSSRGWIDPAPSETSGIFRDLVENVSSGRLRISEAVINADGQLSKLLGRN